MLNWLIRVSLEHRSPVLIGAALLLAYGGWKLVDRPVDIFPDLTQPTVTVMADAHGLVPSEVESLVTIPLESALGGTPGVERIRSTSSDGLTLVRLDFGFDTDLYVDRQMVQERLQLARADLPEGTVPEMAPISSLTGEILDIGLTRADGVSEDDVSLMDIHTLAEWVVRRQLLTVPGVAQVVLIGAGSKQFQVLADPDLLFRHQVSLHEVSDVLAEQDENTTGGYLVEGTRERTVRNLGRIRDADDLRDVVVADERNRPVRVRDIATVREGAAYPRGNTSINGKEGVILLVFKQPGVNTLELTDAVDEELVRIADSLPEGVQLHGGLYRQATFLDRGVDNVVDALRDGAILVAIVLLVFLANFRASAVTLTALPLSFAVAGVLFSWFDLSLNPMTLGGLAIAVGELGDDAIVGVENVIRRLRQGRGGSVRDQIAAATSEVRAPIFSGTLIVVLVLLPLFALTGIEGRLFKPLAVAYIVTLLASMLVSLTVTPALSYLLLGKVAKRESFKERRSPAIAWLQRRAESAIRSSIQRRKTTIALACAAALLAAGLTYTLGSSFLPRFDEGTGLVMTFMPPGTSLAESSRVAGEMERRLIGMEGIQSVARYTGRGEHDEHAPPVTISHILVNLDPEAGLTREESLSAMRERLSDIKGVNFNVGQPLAHRIDHLLSGVQAQIAIKVTGPDLVALREAAGQVHAVAGMVDGVTDLYLEPQVLVPQIQIDPRRERMAELGLNRGELAHELEVALAGRVVGSVLEGERAFDILVRLDEPHRDSVADLRQLPVRLPTGGWARLGEIASVVEMAGPNDINRDNLTRRIAVTCNVEGRSLGEVVNDLEESLADIRAGLPPGMSLRFEGQFESQTRATRLILLLSLLSLAGMIAVLYSQFRSLQLSVQVLACVPAAFIGGALLLVITRQELTVPALVGFISLAGIASRNGILLVAHYLRLMRDNPLNPDLLVRAGRERAAPVVMTALTTGVGLLPLMIGGGQAGREILFPVATVVIGGLLTSTLFEFTLRPALFWSLSGKKDE